MTDAEKFVKIMGGMCKYLRRKNVIFAYNKEYVSDTLLAITADDRGLEQTVERKGNVAQIKMKKARSSAGTFCDLRSDDDRRPWPSDVDERTNPTIEHHDQRSKIQRRTASRYRTKIVVGYVKSCVEHPDSDHLSITETEVGDGKSCKSSVVLPISVKLESRCRKTWGNDARWLDDLAGDASWRRKLWNDLLC